MDGEVGMKKLSSMSRAEWQPIAAEWIAELEATLSRRDFASVGRMMHADGYWRDLLTFGWDFKSLHGVVEIVSWLSAAYDGNAARDFRVEGEPTLGSILDHEETLEVFFEFDTRIARGRGFVRLVVDGGGDGLKAATVLTAMRELKGFPEAIGRRRFRDDVRARSRSLENWRDRRRMAGDFSKRDPDVIVIGAGQSGLMAAARLKQLDIPALVVDRSERLGDVWRKRYRTLTLHNETCMNHFPYMPFPENWPVYLPKDKVADWLEFYAESMELDVWLKTTFIGGRYDNESRTWSVRLRRADGSVREMRPRHLIMGLGVSGLPNIPKLDGIDEFEGTAFHTSGETDDLDVKGKSVLVIGAGTSGHDIAQNMHLRGARVTMLQRSPITVASLEPSSIRAYELYSRNEGVRPLADVDTMVSSVPYDLLRRIHVRLNREMAADDADLLDGLRKVGFLVDSGDNAAFFVKLLNSQSGYYLNIGASDLLIEGKIKLKAGVEIDRVNAHSVIFSDGSSLDVDVIVFATGYKPLQEAVRMIFGQEVAERVGPVWGIGDDGELNAMYKRTGQEGLYIIGGGFQGARVYSVYTAMLIKADLEGLLPPHRQGAASSSQRTRVSGNGVLETVIH